MPPRIRLSLLALLVFASAAPAGAATVVSYNFSVLSGTRRGWGNLTSAYAAPPSWSGDPRTGTYLLSGTSEATAAPGVVAGDLVAAGTGLQYATAGITDGDLDLATWITSSTVTGQANVAGYIAFTLAPTAGNTLTLNSITFTGWRNGTGAPDTINFDYSTDGGLTWLDYASAVVRSTTGSASAASNTFTQSLIIPDGSSVTLRFAPYKSDTTAATGTNTGNWHVNGISVDGVLAAVPEPSAYALLGAGALAASALARRRRRSL